MQFTAEGAEGAELQTDVGSLIKRCGRWGAFSRLIQKLDGFGAAGSNSVHCTATPLGPLLTLCALRVLRGE